jgi:LCP family protein required for cell wall assembly
MPDDFGDNNDTVKHDRAAPETQNNTNDPLMPVSGNKPPLPYYDGYHATPNTGRTIYKDNTMIPPPPPVERESAARARMRKRRVKGRHQTGGEWAWVIIAAALLGIVIVISMSLFLILRVSQDDVEIMPTVAVALPTPVDAHTDFTGTINTGQPLQLDDGRNIVLEPWDGESRFTVLAVGLDRRLGETGLAYRTDTMMLISIDPDSKTIGVLSIPRDLYVEVPGYSELQKINTPMVLGELRQPGFGPKLAMQTVQNNLGIRVHDYLAVDFKAFIAIVDAVGGIDVDVPYTINDPAYPDMNYGYDPFYITAGEHHLDGITALKYARTRHGDSDVDRAKRQQQVIYAVRDRILDLDMLPQLIIKAPSLYNSLYDNVYTGLSLDQMIQLAWYLKDIPNENIHTGVIDFTYARPWTTPQGSAVLVPDRARLGPLMVEVFGSDYSE